MASYSPPGSSAGSKPLPDGWIEEIDASTGRHYFVDTLSLSPQATWIDPRTNPALYGVHDPSMGATAIHQHSAPMSRTASASGTSTPLHAIKANAPIPSLRDRVSQAVSEAPSPVVTSPPAVKAPKVYPEYTPKGAASPLFVLAGAAFAGGIVYRATK